MSMNQQKKKTFFRVLAWILSILMVGSLATTLVTLLIYLLA